MFWPTSDLPDPLERAYTRYFRRVVILAVLLLAICGLVYVSGVPHVQGTYTYSGIRPPDGWVRAVQKHSAWYLGPWGWQYVESGQYGQVGCPVILLIPIQECWKD